MQLKSILTSSLLALSVAADSTYETFAPKQRSGALKLNDQLYRKLTQAPRDHSVAVLLTARDGKYGCALCQEFQPEFEVLAKSWSNGDKEGQSRLLFGTLDVDNGRETFQSVRHVLSHLAAVLTSHS